MQLTESADSKHIVILFKLSRCHWLKTINIEILYEIKSDSNDCIAISLAILLCWWFLWNLLKLSRAMASVQCNDSDLMHWTFLDAISKSIETKPCYDIDNWTNTCSNALLDLKFIQQCMFAVFIFWTASVSAWSQRYCS